MYDLPDFDTLQKMAAENPEALNALLAQETRKIIENAPASMRPRLEGLQFQIEAQRQLAKNPLDSLVRIFDMMTRSFEDLNDALAPFRGEESLLEHKGKQSSHFSNNIVTFPEANRSPARISRS